MTEKRDLTGILQDLAVLYELSLTVGGSLDLKENCERFLRTLMSRKSLDFASVWILERFISDESASDGESFALAYAEPSFRASSEILPEDHPLLERVRAGVPFSISHGSHEFEKLVTEKGIESGTFAIFPLGTIGVLKLYSSTQTTPFPPVRLNKLRHVVEKFAVSIEGCIDHRRVRTAELRRRELEARMLHTQKLESLGLLAGGVAHDFNNLLTAILGNAEYIRPTTDRPGERDCLDNIIGASRRAAELCSQLLAYSGGAHRSSGPVQLNEIIEEMLRLTSVTISKKATLRCELQQSLPFVEGDASQLRQVVLNLVTNASEALEDAAGELTVSTGTLELSETELPEFVHGELRRPGQYVFMEVLDTGCGVPDGSEDRLFDPFFTTKFTGRGLGLAAVLGIVRSHHGAIQVHSQSGLGTRIRVVLPISGKSLPNEELVPRAPESSREDMTVLLADDEPSVLKLLDRIFRRLGFLTVLARDGGEALRLFDQHQEALDLVVLDLTMPVLDGREVFARVNERAPGLPVVLSSGFSDLAPARGPNGAEPAAFLEKPFQLEDLKRLVNDVLLPRLPQQLEPPSRQAVPARGSADS